jgi:hypothetical protein
LEKAENKKGGKDERGNAVGIGILYRIGLVSIDVCSPMGGSRLYRTRAFSPLLGLPDLPLFPTQLSTFSLGNYNGGKVESEKWKVQGGN